jgi:fatty-acyl-CoA synthase/long-chain acyl-CoA synthetase
MVDLLAVHAGVQPVKPAVIDDRPGHPAVTWTFAELNRRANQLANFFLDLGSDAETKIVWCGQNSASLVAVVHAIRKAGAVGVPLNYRLTPDEASYVIDNSDARIVYVDAEYAELISLIRPRLPKVAEVCVFARDGELERRVESYSADAPGSAESSLARASTMTYTSGTTGQPKGAVRANRVESSTAIGLIGLIGYVADDVYITTGPLYHSGPGAFALLANSLGNTVVVQHKFEPEDWLRLVQTYRVSTTFTAPTPIRMVCILPEEIKSRYDRSSMRRLIANAAPWTLNLKKMYMADFPPDSLWEVYGSTELGVDTVLRPEDQLRKPGSCGKPAPGIEIKLFDALGREVTEPFATGELYVRSASMFRAYYKAEEKYVSGRRGDFHTVGDIAYFDDEGFFYIADRKNDMIITGGMNVYPA